MSAGTHKPAEALHQQIAEPTSEAMRLADECEESATHWFHEIDTRLKAAKMLRSQQARIAELERWQEEVRSNSPLLAELQRANVRVQELEASESRTIAQRDHCEEIIDRMADAVLGKDRHEWTSNYDYMDAAQEVEDRIADLEAQLDAIGAGGVEPLRKQAEDDWIQEGPLLYRLTDERRPKNRDEISVTMANSSRTEEARTRRAGELLDAIRAAAPQAVQAAVPDGAGFYEASVEIIRAVCASGAAVAIKDDCSLFVEDVADLQEAAEAIVTASFQFIKANSLIPSDPTFFIQLINSRGAVLSVNMDGDVQASPEWPQDTIEFAKMIGKAMLNRFSNPPEKQAIEAMELALSSHDVQLLSYPPQDAWIARGVSEKLRTAISALAAQAKQGEPKP